MACSCVSGIAIECASSGADCLSGGGDGMSTSIINASGRILVIDDYVGDERIVCM